LIPCRHGVASRIDPAHRAEVGEKHLEGYAVFVSALSGRHQRFPQVLKLARQCTPVDTAGGDRG
jgi:hypothetical protein